jgi:nitrilase
MKFLKEPDGFLMRGGSCIIGPDGTFLAEPVFNKPTFVTAEINLSSTISHSMTLDVTGHYSRPDIFTLQVNTEPRSTLEFRPVNREKGKQVG